jgi:hypothetical protein
MRLVTHAIAGTGLAMAFFWAGLPMRLESLLPHGSLSNNGVLEIVVLTALVGVLPYLLVMMAHAAYERMRRVKGPGWGV